MPSLAAQEIVIEDQTPYSYDGVTVVYKLGSGVAHYNFDPTSIDYMDTSYYRRNNIDPQEESVEQVEVPETNSMAVEIAEQFRGDLAEEHWGNPLSGRSRIHSTLTSADEANSLYEGGSYVDGKARKKSLSCVL